jgi:3-oxoacyl-[acyl-carrier-protein] synthase-1
MTSMQNYQAVKAGHSALACYSNLWDIPTPFTAALFSTSQNQTLHRTGMTRFESLVIQSVTQALEGTDLNLKSPRVVFILSTTKANVELLDDPTALPDILHPGESAKLIAKHLGIETEPIVACNACVSGLSALILAERLLTQKVYDYAIVTGADVLSRFVISGFQSFKSMDANPCRPYDIERLGMNLGEAAATMVLSSDETEEHKKEWAFVEGTIRNDAHHISTPSNKGEGAFRAMMSLLQQINKDELALVNAHGTATMFMDQMEAVALNRAELTDIPVNSYKGIFGHTLGAAGILETVLTMHALEDHTILGTRGFEELGVSVPIQVSAEARHTDKRTFLKLISGFGGSNAALLVTADEQIQKQLPKIPQTRQTHRVTITPEGLTIDGKYQPATATGKALLTELYRTYVGDYPKFYKMDGLSKLGFLASELLMKYEQDELPTEDEQRAVILFNHSASIDTDQHYLASILPGDYYPSPSLFVYTLPNIVTGEIAIRHHLHGETSFYSLASRNEQLMTQIQQAALSDQATTSMITGWIDYEDEAHFCADMYILKTNPTP